MTRPDVKSLADRYCLTTGDRIERPKVIKVEDPSHILPDEPKPKPVEDHAVDRLIWPSWKRALFAKHGFHSIAIVSTDGAVSVMVQNADGSTTRFGHNRGCRPVKFALSGSWKDTVTPRFDTNPFFFMGTQLRFWTQWEKDAKHIAFLLPTLLARIEDKEGSGEKLEKGFWDVGPDYDLTMLELEIMDIGQRNQFPIWDDKGLDAHLEELGAQELRKPGKVMRG